MSFDNTLDIVDALIVKMAKDELHAIKINVNERNKFHGTKEMTISEIEEKLGHKVKIVKEK